MAGNDILGLPDLCFGFEAVITSFCVVLMFNSLDVFYMFCCHKLTWCCLNESCLYCYSCLCLTDTPWHDLFCCDFCVFCFCGYGCCCCCHTFNDEEDTQNTKETIENQNVNENENENQNDNENDNDNDDIELQQSKDNTCNEIKTVPVMTMKVDSNTNHNKQLSEIKEEQM